MMADRRRTLPPAHPLDPDTLARSLRTLSIKQSSPPSANTRQLPPSRTLSRRASLDIRAAAVSPAPPTIRKRASLASLNSRDGASTPNQSMRRRSSVLSLRGSDATVSPPPPTAPVKDLTPPPQDPYAETTVILHDSSYKHRYQRPKTSAAELASIVERPERIPAAVMGICSAQVRAGKEQLSIMKSVRMGKLSDPEVMLVHAHTPLDKGKKPWPEELVAMCGASEGKMKRGQLEVPDSCHQGDLYLCGESLEDLEGCIGAVYDGVDAVFGGGPVKKAFVCIRPPGHHCAERDPSGFCWLNNVHIAIAHAAKEHGLSHAVILDFDLHHGDGSQAIAWSINELASSGSTAVKRTQGLSVPTIGYFSLHDINSYPCEHGDMNKIQSASINLEAHGQFIHNIHLKPYTSRNEFWQLYDDKYTSIFSKAREFLTAAATGKQWKNREFSAGIFLSAGFDASEHESPGMQRHKIHVPTDFFAKFTADAVDLATEFCEGRVVSVLEGGYSDRALTSGVLAHISGLSCVPPDQANFTHSSLMAPTYAAHRVAWTTEWWTIDRLEELEKLTQKHPPVAERRERRTTSFMDPTAASVARIAEAPIRRTSSSFHSLSPSPAPPPPKPWEVQAFELSAFFIPQYEESKPSAPAEKGRPGTRKSMAPSAPKEMTMKLRDRKPKPAEPPKPELRRRASVVGTADSRTPNRASRANTPALNGRAAVTTAPVGATVAGPRQIRNVVQKRSMVDLGTVTKELEGVSSRPRAGAQKATAAAEKAARERDEAAALAKERKEAFAREQAEKQAQFLHEQQRAAEGAEREKMQQQQQQQQQQQRRRGIPRPAPSAGLGAVASMREKMGLGVDVDAAGQIVRSPPGSPREGYMAPLIEVDVPVNGGVKGGMNGSGMGMFHGVMAAARPGLGRDMTFRGGDIRFGGPLGNGVGAEAV